MKPRRAKPKLPFDTWLVCWAHGELYHVVGPPEAWPESRLREVYGPGMQFIPITITARKAGKRRKR